MDAVKSFNLELSGLYEVKPPISKAKMTSITKGAIKAIKFYKHVVQSVEKFIQKCKPEYKVPGLYVIDSIVRQSRHQFGADRDVFAPRFAKNMQQTFINLFACPEEEKSKVIRVLNLWQKNQVFAPEAIQPLFDLADPNHPVYKEQNLIQSNGLGSQNVGALVKGSPAIQKSPAKSSSQVIHVADGYSGPVNMNVSDSNNFTQLQQLHKTLQKQGGEGGKTVEGQSVRFDRKLLDFDYDDEEEEDQLLQHINPSPKPPPPVHNTSSSAMDTVGSLLSNPEVLRQLQTLQQSMSQSQQYQEIEKLRKLQEMKQQEEEFDKHLAQTVPNLPFAAECDLKPMMNPPPPSMQPYYMTGIQDLHMPPPGYKIPHPVFEIPPIPEMRIIDSDVQSRGSAKETAEVEVINLDQNDSRSPSPNEDRYLNRRRRSRSRERSRDRARGKDKRSKRSRSRSHSRERRRRTRSRDRDRNRDRDRERDKDREKDRERDKERDREKEKERRKRGLPPLKRDYLCVCSTTLWVGHLSKLVHQEELSDAFGEYGEVVSIDLIPPRGCAFLVMHRRQDAARCLEKLKNHKLQGKAITLAWAPGKGLKGKDLKDYWEVDLGASYIPWAKVKPDIDVELLEDGGMIDEDSMPDWLKAKIAEKSAIMASPHIALMPNIPGMGRPPIASLANLDTSQPPPMPGTPMLQPPPSLPLQMVNPFQLNLSMNLPPNMMNMPMGVPPPSMPPTPMMANPLLGFPPGPPPGMLPPPISLPAVNKPPPLHKPMPPFSLVQMPPVFHEENMDIEMEDVNKLSKPPPLSDQLLASLGQNNNDESSLSAAVNRLNAVSGNKSDDNDVVEGYRDRSGRDNERDRKEEHGNFGRNWENRDDRENRDYRDSRDYRGNRDFRGNRDYRDNRDHRGSRDHDRRDLRHERSNRWIDKDRNDRGDRRDRSDKNVNERLKDIARHDSYPSNTDSGQDLNKEQVVPFEPPLEPPSSLIEGDVFASRFNTEGTIDQNDDINAFINPEPPSEEFLNQGEDEAQPQNFEGVNDWQSNQRDEWSNENESQAQNLEENGDWQSNQRSKWDNNNEEGGQTQDFGGNSDWQSNQRNEWDNNNDTGAPWEHPPPLMAVNADNFSMPPMLGFDRNNGPPPHHMEPPRENFNRDTTHRLPHLTVRNEMFLKEDRFQANNDFNTENNAFEMGSSDFGSMDNSLLGPGPVDPGYGGNEGFDQSGSMYGEPQNEMASYDESEQFPPPFGGLDRGRPGFGGPDHGRHGFGGPGFGDQEQGGSFSGRGFRGRDGRRGFGGRDRGRGGFGNARGDFWPRNTRGGDGFRPRGNRGGSFQQRGQGRGQRPFGPRWNEEGDRGFKPRYDGPPDHFRGPKFNDRPRRGNYDDSRSRPRRDRERDDRKYRRDFEEERPPREKRSRWGGVSREESFYNEEGNSENVPNEEFTSEGQTTEQSNDDNYNVGNSTPLHDEPQEPQIESSVPEQTVESESTTAVTAEEQQ